jgi:hypothetical protein
MSGSLSATVVLRRLGDGYLIAALAFLVWSVTRRDVAHVGGGRPPVSVGERG